MISNKVGIKSNTYYAEKSCCLKDYCFGNILVIDDYSVIKASGSTDIQFTMNNYFNSSIEPLVISFTNSDFSSCSSNALIVSALMSKIQTAIDDNSAYNNNNPNKTLQAESFFKTVNIPEQSGEATLNAIYSLDKDISYQVTPVSGGYTLHKEKYHLCKYMSEQYGNCAESGKSNIYVNPVGATPDVATFNTPVFFNRCTICNICKNFCQFSKAIRNVYTDKFQSIQEIDSDALKEALVNNILYVNSVPKSIKVDTISEYSEGNGVDISGVNISEGTIDATGEGEGISSFGNGLAVNSANGNKAEDAFIVYTSLGKAIKVDPETDTIYICNQNSFKLNFFGTGKDISQSIEWLVCDYTPTKEMDNKANLETVANVLCSLIDTLKDYGILGGKS